MIILQLFGGNMSAAKSVYKFGDGKAEGKADMKLLLGGKGANLAEMANLGIPVPAGFTISTEICNEFYKSKGKYAQEVINQVKAGVVYIEKIMGATFGDPKNPLLVSVRSGAPASMPGMMDTVLNLGLNDKTVQGLITNSKNERFGWDSYRRFAQMYGDVVLGMKPQSKEEEDPFEVIIHELKQKRGVKLDTELSAADLKELVQLFKTAIKKNTGRDFPTDPWEQLWGAISAVFQSWNNQRALTYRKLHNIPANWGTAVNVQAMVYGNMGEDCATGVAFTRDPATGERKFYGEYLVNAQGEDVVAGIRNPQPVNESTKTSKEQQTLQSIMPAAYKDLDRIYNLLEKHYRDMQDIEFTIQKGKLWMLQTRNGKRTAAAAVRIAVEMADEKLIDTKTAIMRLDPNQIDQLLHPTFDPKAEKECYCQRFTGFTRCCHRTHCFSR